MASTGMIFSPTTDEISDMFDRLIDTMVLSVQGLPRVDELLFQPVEELQTRTISSIKLPEEVVLLAKHKVRKVIEINSVGPIK